MIDEMRPPSPPGVPHYSDGEVYATGGGVIKFSLNFLILSTISRRKSDANFA